MEPVLVILIVFSFVTIMVKMNLDYKRSKLLHQEGGEDNSLRMSELKALIQEAVEEVAAPLHERLEALETRVDEQEAHQIKATTEALLLEGPAERKS